MVDDREPTDKQATLAGGCFWCTEAAYKAMDGVKAVISGYAGGAEATATYQKVATGETDHREAVQVIYDPTQVGYEAILDVYWRNIDPTDDGGQFADRGPQYTTAIYYHDEEQCRIAEQTKRQLEDSDRFDDAIVTDILPYTTFFPAEDHHQDYAQKQPGRYNQYKQASGRSAYFNDVWED